MEMEGYETSTHEMDTENGMDGGRKEGKLNTQWPLYSQQKYYLLHLQVSCGLLDCGLTKTRASTSELWPPGLWIN